MTLFWPYYGMGSLPPASVARRARLRELEARIDAFLLEKEYSDNACSRVVNNVRDCKDRLRGELALMK